MICCAWIISTMNRQVKYADYYVENFFIVQKLSAQSKQFSSLKVQWHSPPAVSGWPIFGVKNPIKIICCAVFGPVLRFLSGILTPKIILSCCYTFYGGPGFIGHGSELNILFVALTFLTYWKGGLPKKYEISLANRDDKTSEWWKLPTTDQS